MPPTGNERRDRTDLVKRLVRQDCLALLGLLTVYLVLDVAVLSIAESELQALVASGVLAAQPVLIALWTAWAPYTARRRYPTGLTAMALVVFLYAAYSSLLGSAFWLLLCSGLVFALLVLLRWRWGWSFQNRPCRVATRPPPFQFSLRYLLAGTTATAVLLAIGTKLAHRREPFSIDVPQFALALVLSQLFAMVVLVAALSAIRTASLKGAVLSGVIVGATALVACLLAAWLLYLVFAPSPFFTVSYTNLLAAMAWVAAPGVAVAIVTGAALRRAGYRTTKSSC